MADIKLNLETATTHKQKIAAVKSMKFWLYDTARHCSLPARDVYIDGSGQIWYNESRIKDRPIWEPLNASGEGCYLKNVTIEIYDHESTEKGTR